MSDRDTEGVLLGNFTYKEDGEPLQHFAVKVKMLSLVTIRGSVQEIVQCMTYTLCSKIQVLRLTSSANYLQQRIIMYIKMSLSRTIISLSSTSVLVPTYSDMLSILIDSIICVCVVTYHSIVCQENVPPRYARHVYTLYCPIDVAKDSS